jgi:hypothetical protein
VLAVEEEGGDVYRVLVQPQQVEVVEVVHIVFLLPTLLHLRIHTLWVQGVMEEQQEIMMEVLAMQLHLILVACQLEEAAVAVVVGQLLMPAVVSQGQVEVVVRAEEIY